MEPQQEQPGLMPDSNFSDLALQYGLKEAQPEKLIELENKLIESQTRTNVKRIFNPIDKKVGEIETVSKAIITRDNFFGRIDNPIEFIALDLVSTTAFISQYLSERRKKWKNNKGVVSWVRTPLQLTDVHDFDAHYKDNFLSLTRSRGGWFAELWRSRIVVGKGKNLDFSNEKKKSFMDRLTGG